MSSPREQQQLRAMFCDLAAPWVQPGREDALRSAVCRREGKRLERLVSHGELHGLFSLRERRQPVPADSPCLYGLCNWQKGTFAEAEAQAAWGGSLVIIALDGSWLAMQQEDGPLNAYHPAPPAPHSRP